MRIKLLLLVAVAAACGRVPAAELSLVDHTRAATTLDRTPVADIPAAVDATYRVRPDRRFLIAAADVVELTTGHRPAEVSIDQAGDRWQVRIDNKDAGSLPDLASFNDALAMLRHLANAAPRAHATALSTPNAAKAVQLIGQLNDPKAQFEALQEIGIANDSRARQLAARALVSVNMLTNDPYETADALRARALAAVALATHIDGETALLARIFGYERDAAADAPRPGTDSLTKAFARTSGELGDPTRSLPDAAPLASPLAGERLVRAHFEAVYTSAVKGDFDTEFDQRASEPGARKVIESLGAPASPMLAQLKKALTTMLLTKYAPSRLKPEDCISGNLLGAAMRARMLRDFMSVAAGSRAVRRAADTLFPSLDSRPADLFAASSLAMGLGDLSRYDSLFTAGFTRSPSATGPGEIAWHERNIGNRDHLRQLVDDPHTPTHDRVLALSVLGELGENDSVVVERFERFLAENDYQGYSTYASYLNEHHAWATKERAAKHWLDAHPYDTSIQAAYFASSEADALEYLGRYDEAWRILGPRVPVYSYNVLSVAMSLQQRLGHTVEADQYGRKLMERYPGDDARADYATVLWREKRWDDAAALLTKRPRSEALTNAFGKAFEDAAAPEVQSAIAALDRAGADPDLIDSCVTNLQRSGHNALALTAATTYIAAHPLKSIGPTEASIAICGWRALNATDGPAAAMEWLRQRVDPGAHVQMVTIAYQMQAYELVAAFATPQTRTEKSIEMNFYRAAALTAMRVPRSDPRWNEVALIAATEGSPPDSLHPITQYLLGEIDEKSFLAKATNEEWHTSVSYFIALHALVVRDYDKALPLLLSAAEGPETLPPTSWAIETLFRWTNAKKNWAQVAASGQM